ncbi:hypothetical protein [Nonomuraea indica]|uniref:Uncharacterized protein n=1 Tax=Nonomuraea indica TaxID=1581193 RepID=A0ABW8A6I5_9ACTN
MADPFNGVVTAATVYGKVVEVGERVAGVDHKVEKVDEKVTGMVARVDDHEVRIRVLEVARWPHAKLTLLIAASGLVVSLLAVGIGVFVNRGG